MLLHRKIKTQRFWLAIIFLIIAGVILASPAFAQFGLEYASTTGLGTTGLKPLVFNIINILLGFLGIVAVIIILYGGFVWMTAAGNKDKIEKAKKILINGLIGLALILASWGIANFILGSLWGATGGGTPCQQEGISQVCATTDACSGTQTCADGFWGSCVKDDPACPLGPANQLIITNYTPADGAVNVIRNIVVRIKFNRNINPASINYGNNFTITGPVGLVDGSYTVSGSRIDFKANGACAPNNDCFGENTNFTINFTAGGITSTDGKTLVCSALNPCSSSFATGTIIDTEDPAVSMAVDSQFCAGTINIVKATASDDSSIGEVKFYYDSINQIDGAADIPSIPPTPPYLNCQGTRPDNCSAGVNWDATGLVTGDYSLTAQATDLDSHTKISASKTVKLRPAHCCNTIKDQGEEGIDCGGECDACNGVACDIDSGTPDCQPNDDICASRFCNNINPDPDLFCKCQSAPIIDWLSPGNGAPGNLITIGGRHFGSTPGAVTFLNRGLNAPFPSTVNPDCINSWTDNQIIIVVPAGAVDSPLKVTTSAGYSDETNDARGPILADFAVNTTVRPGLCKLNPTTGQIAAQVGLTGIRFGPVATSRTIEFGNDVNFVTADSINWLSNTQAQGNVPNIRSGATSIRVKVDSEYSNYLSFNVLSGTAGGPQIDYLDPITGPTGQYMTIFGRNFGNEIGTVTFSGANADINFPAKCAKNFWHNTYIIVKVPTVAAGTNYNVKVKTAKGAESNEVNFTGAAGTPGPGICGLVPDNGPVNTPVNFYGDNFGEAAGQAIFYNNQPATTITSWENQGVKANVPTGAITGTVYLQDSLAKQSNKAPFKVGACEADEQCESGGKCCADKTCRPTCPEKIKATYGWSFTTGDYFIARQCLKEAEIPATGPTGEDVCTNAQIAVRFTATVDDNSVLNNNVLVEKCADDNCDPASTSPVNGTITMATLATNPVTEGFTFTPDNPFSQGTTYKVTLRGGEGGITDEAGVPLIDDFFWTFKTRPDGKQCQVGEIKLAPAKSKLVILGATQDYVANIISQEDPCLLINSASYSWIWDSADIKVADISGATNNTATVVALGPGNTKIKASITSEKKEGIADLTVDLSGLQVLSAMPTCDKACTNAQIRARFSNWVDENTLTIDNIKLFKCQDKKCLSDGLAPVSLNSPSYTWNGLTNDSLLDINPVAALSPNSFYRVIIKGGETGIKNYLGGGLSNPNYKAASGEECEPPNFPDCGADCLHTGGECALNSLGCSASGLHTGSVATTCGNGAIDKGENCDDGNTKDGDGCSAECLLEGSVSTAVCGDGIVGQGEACDDKNQTSGDGCSDKCLKEGVTNGWTLANLVPNPSFESSTNGWYVVEPTHLAGSREANPSVVNGNYVMKLTKLDDDAGPGWDGKNYTHWFGYRTTSFISDTVGKTYTASVWVKAADANAVGKKAEIYIQRAGGSAGTTCGGVYPGGTNCSSVADCPPGINCLGTPGWYQAAVSNIVLTNNWQKVSVTINFDSGPNSDAPAYIGISLEGILFGSLEDPNQLFSIFADQVELYEQAEVPQGIFCGNNIIETGEDCDDGNFANGDGCSSKCLAEGASGSTCGDGKVGVGEDCDDGNTASGDGCSSICLNEGPKGLAVCGNGAVEDGQANDSYSWVFGTGGGVCQPEKVEVAPDNIAASVGQKINYLANLYSVPDECSETGQLLDATKYNWSWNSLNLAVAAITSDGKPKQTATAAGIGATKICAAVDLDKDGTFDISDCADLSVGQTSGPGIPCRQSDNSCCDSGVSKCSAGYSCLEDLSESECPLTAGKFPGCRCCCDPTNDQCPAPLSCSADKAPCSGGNRGLCCGCKADAECGDPVNIGCGKDTCCHNRPVVLNIYPNNNQTNVCRNVKIKAEFTEAMQTASFVGKVEIKNIADGSFIKGVTSSGGKTILYFSPEKPLAAMTSYQVTIKKEVLSEQQISMSQDKVFVFETGDIICDADYLKVSITHDANPLVATNQDLFTCVRSDCADDIDSAIAGNQHSYLAEAMDITGASLTGYDYNWNDSDPDDIVSHNATGAANITITANNKNGKAVYNIKATPQADSDSSGIVSNRVNITNFICENPWPSVSDWPWLDDSDFNVNSSCNTPVGCSNTDTHFELMYCRDAGAAGVADDLPVLPDTPIIRGQSGDFIKEYLFVIP